MFYSGNKNIQHVIVLATILSESYCIYVYCQHYSNALVSACYSPHQSGPVECFPSSFANAFLVIICMRGLNNLAFTRIWYAIWKEAQPTPKNHPTSWATVESALPTTRTAPSGATSLKFVQTGAPPPPTEAPRPPTGSQYPAFEGRTSF